MRQLKISKSITNRDSASLEKYLQDRKGCLWSTGGSCRRLCLCSFSALYFSLVDFLCYDLGRKSLFFLRAPLFEGDVVFPETGYYSCWYFSGVECFNPNRDAHFCSHCPDLVHCGERDIKRISWNNSDGSADCRSSDFSMDCQKLSRV